MNGQQWAPMCAGFAVAVVLFLVLGYFLRKRDMTAHLAPVKRELKKEKQWLRRGEYNAAMVKGRQNLELFLKLVAEFNGIELDNSAQAMANAKSGPDGRGQRETYRMNGRKRQRVMTFQQFGWWLDENGYLDRVGKWELNEIRVIGNKAVHENYVSKEDAWNQYNYMEDVLRIVADRHANRRKQRGPAVKKSQAGCHGASVKKTSGAQANGRGQQSQNRGQGQTQGRSQGRTGQNQPKNGNQGQSQKNSEKQSGGKSGQTARSGGNARQDAKVSGKAEQKKTNGAQKTVQKTEGKKAAEQRSAVNKQAPKKAQDGSNAKTAGKSQTSERTQQKREAKTTANKVQQSKEVKPTEKVVEKAAVKTPAVIADEKTAENAQPEKLSSSAKRRQRRKRAKVAREAAEAAGAVRETAPQSKTAKPTEKRTVCHGKETDRQPRQVQPQTSMRIVTLSQPTGGWTAGTDKKEAVKSEKSKKNTAPQLKRKSGEAEKRTQGNIAARQTQNEGAADPTARRRRRPKRRPAAEHAGNNVERTAAGGGDHEE